MDARASHHGNHGLSGSGGSLGASDARSNGNEDSDLSSGRLPEAPPSTPSRRQTDAADSVRVLKPRRAAPADAVRPTRAEVNLAALRHNLRVVARHAGTAQVWPVLKADGYGHGAPATARTLERAGAQGFCVALLEEAVELRDAGVSSPILVMGGYYGGAYEEISARGLIPVVYDISHLEGLSRAARSTGRPVEAHLKVDTGMARLGVRMADLERFAASALAHPDVKITGLMTHLACAEVGNDGATDLGGFTADQLARFEEATARLASVGITPRVRHAANSAAMLRGQGILDAVRPGLAVFGVAPAGLSTELRPTMRVRTEVVDLRTIEPGESVGYGALFRATRKSVIATVPVGYADGLSRHLSNRGHMLVRGRRAPIVGAVSMDMSMLDVTDVPAIGLRDEVVVLGTQEGALGKDTISAEEVAGHAGTIPWEILTSISRRVPRFYREP
ncbi:Alanine racemase [Labilithrix luteola]|uniref:Alanine racemase n=1 Tax=Labilithrix luteola TaxID=1391654 RepID=A0A0K1Q210_9BACT|nr:alanine racemase [Labilithrix luteola]AKU99757.1 Alanine racemase [Labilithrix luteola]